MGGGGQEGGGEQEMREAPGRGERHIMCSLIVHMCMRSCLSPAPPPPVLPGRTSHPSVR